MERKQGAPDEAVQAAQQNANAADADIWTQLTTLASRSESDPVLRLLVSEAIARFEELRGVTATIASRYRALVDAVPDAVIIHDEAGNVLDANEAACQLYRRSRDSLLQSSMLELNPELGTDFLASLHETQANGCSLTTSSQILRDDGSISQLELHAREYLDAGRIRIIAVIRDLGPREVAIQQLSDSETWLRQLILEIDKGVVVWGRRGEILSSNPFACRTFQINEAELLALTPDQLERWIIIDAQGDPIPRSEMPWIRALETGRAQESVMCGLQLSHMPSTIWLSVSAVPHFSPGQEEPDRAATVFTEVTRLQRDALMFAHSQSLNMIGTWELDFETQTLLCSAQLHAILDVPNAIPLSRERFLDHFQGRDLDRFRIALASVREHGFDQFEALLTTSIGRKRRVRIRMRLLQSGERAHGVFGTLKDITAETPGAPLDSSP
ncbi:PAS domain-containing protein [Dokdonella sp.]|uniref:PAS domain-containing protein n=1 Tax=Dokdonella sp. TaxID=2291710 RepID=UPI0035274E12